MTIAIVATFALGASLGLAQSFWAVIAALVATQSNLGGTLKAGLEQFLGSVFGAAWGALITLFVPHNSSFALGLTLVVSVAPLTLLTAFSPGFRIAPITAILVLLASVGLRMGPVDFALERVFEIGLGCLIGVAVSVWVVPAHAYALVLGNAGEVAALLARQLNVLASIWEHPETDVHALPTEIRFALSRLENLTKEAARERRTRLVNEPDPEPLSRTLARLHTDISTLGRILVEPLPRAVHDRLATPWAGVAKAAEKTFRDIGRVLPLRDAAPDLAPVTDAIHAYEAAVDEVRRAGLTIEMSSDAVARIFALGFVLDQFRRNLEDLLGRVNEVHRTSSGLDE